MNKLNKLFAILFAMLGVGTLSAQTDVTNKYLTNAGFDTDFTHDINATGDYTSVNGTGNQAEVSSWTRYSGNTTGWSASATFQYGTKATFVGNNIPSKGQDGSANGGCLGIYSAWGGPVGYTQEVTLPAGVYTLSYAYYNPTGNTGGTSLCGFIPNGGSLQSSTLTTFTSNTWTIDEVEFVVASTTTGRILIGFQSAGGSANVPRYLVDWVKLSHKPFTDVTEENSIDLTSMSGNTTSNWTFYSGVKSSETKNITYKDLNIVQCYADNSYTGDAMTQTIKGLPNGIYNVGVYCMAHSAWINDVAADGATGYTYLYANEYSLDVAIRNADGATTKQLYSFEKIKIENGELTVRVHNAQAAANWISARINNITFLGPDKTLEETGFNNNVTALKALDKEGVPNAFVSQIDGIITTYGNAEASTMTLSELMDANAEIKALIDAYNVLAGPYANLKSLIATCTSINTNSVEAEKDAKTTFAAAIAAATTNAENATTADAINEQYNTLEAARKVYVEKADPTNDTYFDYTYKIKNAAVANGNNWTGSRTNSGQQYTGAPDNTYFDSWDGAGQDIYQELTGLPSGLYTLTAAGRASTDCTSAYIYLNDAKAEIDKAGNSGNDLGNGWKWFTTEKTSVAGTAKIGFKANTANSQWAGADDFKFYYYGFDVTSAQTSVSSLVAEAKELAAKPMNTGVLAELNAAISGADASKTTRLELNSMIDALSSAVADAEASIPAYEKLERYISMTEVFTDVTAYQQKYDNGQFTTDEVEAVRQELNIMRYNAASAIFTNKVEVTGWTGDLANGVRSDQHWSGETKSYYDANSWTDNYVDLKHTLSTTVTLPEGTYVLKAAGRSDSDVTLTLNIKDGETTLESVQYTGKGNAGYGIDTDGNPNFSEEGVYAYEGKGRGWEWEFAKFELNTETTVTLYVEVDYNSIRNRFGSFSDITLWMDDETYINVNGHAIDAPLAAAKALVNTKPMGTDENTALVNAIAQGEGTISTPAQLDGAVAALNTAVAKANAWVAAYNEAKAPLVAALERFEADFNLGDGLHGYMKNGLWADVLEKVQAAAEAKDATDSYEGFADAAESLNTALNAAQASIDAYVALNEAIDKADALVAAHKGEGAFQISQATVDGLGIADAQATYTAAAAEAEDVRSTAETLNAAINGIVLNAPEADARYTLTFNCEGHTASGNAITLIEGGRNGQGDYGIKYLTKVNANYAQAFTLTQATGTNCYYLSQTNPAGEAIYLTTATLGYDANNFHAALRLTTDATKALEVQIIPTDGGYILYNTQAKAAIAHNGNNNNDAFTNNNATFSIAKAAKAEVTLNITDAKWSTLMLPFDAELPEGVVAYSCGEIDEDGVKLTLTPATSLEANTPYLVNGTPNTYNFAGYGLATKDSYTEGLFTGTYVDYQTTANGSTYVLQKKEGKEAAFYLVGDEVQPYVRAYRCYMTYKNAAGAPMFSISRGDDTTGIQNSQFTIQNSTVIYDLMGRKVTTMVKGGMYIVNGKKVIVK